MKILSVGASVLVVATALAVAPANAATLFSFTTGGPDGVLATASGPASPGHLETETADDFILSERTRLNHASFTGLVPTGTALSSIKNVEIEFYKIFPGDSANPPSGKVPSRVNSPADEGIASATRDGLIGSLSFSTIKLASAFTARNSVINGINPLPNNLTGGEGAVTGEEVTLNVDFTMPVDLTAGHYFFRPEVELTNGQFLWLSAIKIASGPGAVPGDLQTWIRNSDLSPDWLRIGTDVVGDAPHNASFSLDGVAGVPEPASWTLMVSGFGLAGASLRRRRMATA